MHALVRQLGLVEAVDEDPHLLAVAHFRCSTTV
jgi:hypothetical protein